MSRGGENTWMNCVTACIKCNTQKGARTPKEFGHELLYVPYEPNHYENMILQNRNILADQMEYLMGGVPKHSRVLLNFIIDEFLSNLSILIAKNFLFGASSVKQINALVRIFTILDLTGSTFNCCINGFGSNLNFMEVTETC